MTIPLHHTQQKSTIGSFLGSVVGMEGKSSDDAEIERHGQWLRRRRLDGALNRVPRNFYPRIWNILEKCRGINIEGKVIPQTLTQEMTPGELKFALEVETILNTIPQPEYRQLVVEAMMVLALVAEYHHADQLGDIVSAQDIVHVANNIFLSDQKQQDGDATLCCAREKREPGCPLRLIWYYVLHDSCCHCHTQLLPSRWRVGLYCKLRNSRSIRGSHCSQSLAPSLLFIGNAPLM
ncbi:hypothetical protein Pmani_011375 [Petrolisthes manimaculis]|uniref:Phosphorylase b kinase regulatory subunit n=1 Tax=Petrolisthes manimaculis TaxID=1843537 RepID=A0AAE1PZQ0_9EUCA|nr:hypothetical protein Pmani_011375 [Petrolisthes manimaculis]